MVINKKKEFGKKKQHLSMLAKAISHPARISILKILAKKKNCSCNDLVELLPLSQSTVSQHLNALKISGLIQVKTQGPKCIYSLNKNNLKEFANEFKRMIKSVISKKIGSNK